MQQTANNKTGCLFLFNENYRCVLDEDVGGVVGEAGGSGGVIELLVPLPSLT